MRKHISGSVFLLSLVAGLHGMENNLSAEQETPAQASREAKEGGACTALIPELKPFLVGGFLMYAGGKLVPVFRKFSHHKKFKWRDQTSPVILCAKAPRKGLNPATREKIALPYRPKPHRYRRPGEGLLPQPAPKSEQQLRQEARENSKYGLDW